jgi:ketosteroid isomerase-like protein
MRSCSRACALFLLTCVVPVTARADDAARDRAVELIERWLAAQNSGDFAAYSALYADDFRGTRRSGQRTVELDRAGWLKDRARMFQKPMQVQASHIVVFEDLVDHRTMTANFDQSWQSGRYHDLGPKRMTIVNRDGVLSITREELTSSFVTSLPATHGCWPTCTQRAPPAAQRREVKECELACAESAGACVHYAQVIAGGMCGLQADRTRAIAVVEEACKRPDADACEAAAALLADRSDDGGIAHAIDLLTPHCKPGSCALDSILPKLLVKRGEKADLERALRIRLAMCASEGSTSSGWAGEACAAAANMIDAGQGAPRSPKRVRALRERAETLEHEAATPHCCVEDEGPD